jgi:hypothetical protein
MKTCASCKHARAILSDGGVATGYFACALQAAWRYRVRCNIERHEVKA